MPVVRKVTTPNTVAKKRTVTKPNVRSVRNPSQVEEMGDTDFGTLDATKDGLIVSYDNVTNKFVLITADELLATSAEDSDIDDTFVTTLEGELNLGQIQIDSLDGGGF